MNLALAFSWESNLPWYLCRMTIARGLSYGLHQLTVLRTARGCPRWSMVLALGEFGTTARSRVLTNVYHRTRVQVQQLPDFLYLLFTLLSPPFFDDLQF